MELDEDMAEFQTLNSAMSRAKTTKKRYLLILIRGTDFRYILCMGAKLNLQLSNIHQCWCPSSFKLQAKIQNYVFFQSDPYCRFQLNGCFNNMLQSANLDSTQMVNNPTSGQTKYHHQ